MGLSSGAFGTFDGIFEQAISWIKQVFCSGRVAVILVWRDGLKFCDFLFFLNVK